MTAIVAPAHAGEGAGTEPEAADARGPAVSRPRAEGELRGRRDGGRAREAAAAETHEGGEEGWAALLLQDRADDTPKGLLGRAAIGLSLAGLYGVALGTRGGGLSLLQHAAGVPLGLLLVGALGAPSLFVFLSLSRAAVDARDIASAAVRGLANAGVLLSGLAPAAALFAVTSDTPQAAAAAVKVGLLLGGGAALARMVFDVMPRALEGTGRSAIGVLASCAGFAVFAITMAMRVWTAVLPLLGGAS